MRLAGWVLAIYSLGFSVAAASDIHLRFARVTLAEGRVEVEQGITGERIPAERNLPVGENFWVETASGARAELDLDDGSSVRLGPASLLEFSDLARLSTGQRITLVSLERGTLYATSEPARLDAFLIVAPGLEVTFLAGSRVRVEVNQEISTVAVLEGRVRFSSRSAELDLHEGQTVQVNPANAERFQLLREITAAELDRWNETRDREAAARAAGTRLPMFPVGLGELDAYGKWLDHPQLGKVWQPRATEGGAPFRAGRWRWYDGIGYTWVSSEPWGWAPYHYGRWAYVDGSGWVWVPGKGGQPGSFEAGEVYWLRAPGFVGWGPLAPGDNWPAGRPSLYWPANTTLAAYTPGDRLIDPGRAARFPQDALKAAQLTASLPAPSPLPALARQRVTRVGTTRIVPVTADQTFDRDRAEEAQSKIQIIGAEPAPPAAEPAPAPSAGVTYYDTPLVAPAPPPPPPRPAYYPVYVPEVIVIERERDRGGNRGQPGGNPAVAPGPVNRHPSPPPAAAPAPRPAPPAPAPAPAPAHTPRTAPAPAPAPEPAPRKDNPPGDEGPEHRTRQHNPESGDAPSRRR